MSSLLLFNCKFVFEKMLNRKLQKKSTCDTEIYEGYKKVSGLF